MQPRRQKSEPSNSARFAAATPTTTGAGPWERGLRLWLLILALFEVPLMVSVLSGGELNGCAT